MCVCVYLPGKLLLTIENNNNNNYSMATPRNVSNDKHAARASQELVLVVVLV